MRLRVEFLLKTDSGYPRDAEVTLFTLANPGRVIFLSIVFWRNLFFFGRKPRQADILILPVPMQTLNL